MAKLSGPLFSESATGSIGGCLTYDSHRGVPVVRRRGTTAQPRSHAQLAARSRFARLQRMWAAKAQDERAAWDVWAASHGPWYAEGDKPHPWTGMHAFQALNNVLLMMSRNPVDDPPSVLPSTPLVNFTAGYNPVVYPKITFSWNIIFSFNHYALIHAALHPAPHTIPDKSEYRYIQSIGVQQLRKEWAYPPRGQLHFRVPVADRRNGLRSALAVASCWSDG